MSEKAALPQDAVRHMAAADFYDLLALLLEVPAPEWIELLARPELAEDFATIAFEVGVPTEEVSPVSSRLASMSASIIGDAEALGTVRREYTRLFNHPKKPVIQPYEGVFVDDELVREGKASTHSFLFVNPSAEEAERAYREAGFARTHKSSVPADCITTELQFMGQLHLMAAKANLEGNEDVAGEASDRLASFWSKRVARWIPRFFERCVEESRIELYSLVGKMGTMLMDVEAALIGGKQV